MDSEHRHELSSNELVDFITNFPTFISKHYLQIIGVCLILAAIVFSGPARGYLKSKKLAGNAQTTAAIQQAEQSKGTVLQSQQTGIAGGESALLVAANKLEIAAVEAGTPELSALVLIKRAEVLRADLHFSSEDAEAEVAKGQLAKAEASYKQAIAKAGGNVTLAAKAEFGLGLCAEEAGDYAGAEAIYKKVIDNADYAVTVFPTQAQGRIDSFADNKVEFVFADAPKPEVKVETVKGQSVTGKVEIVEPKVEDVELKVEDVELKIEDAMESEEEPAKK